VILLREVGLVYWSFNVLFFAFSWKTKS
jgi:hypothetical protein